MVFWSALRSRIRGALSRADFDREAVKLTGNQTVQGIKTFSNVVKAANPVNANDLTTKQYVDNKAYDADNVYSKAQSDAKYVAKENTRDVAIEINAAGEAYFNLNKIQGGTGYRNWTGLKFNTKQGNNAFVNVFKLFFKNVNEGVFLECENDKLTFNRATTLKNVNAPVDNNDAVNKAYVDSAKNGLEERINNNQDLINQNIADIGTKANAADVYPRSETYTKTEADALINAKANAADLNNYVLKTNTANTIITAPVVNLTSSNGDLELRASGGISCGNKVIKQVAAPTANDHAATKKYVDDVVAAGGNFNPNLYYDKTASDNRYYQKSQVYTKTESDNRYYQKSQVDSLLNNKANSRDVVNLTGTQTISGEKRFTGKLWSERYPLEDYEVANKRYVVNQQNVSFYSFPNMSLMNDYVIGNTRHQIYRLRVIFSGATFQNVLMVNQSDAVLVCDHFLRQYNGDWLPYIHITRLDSSSTLTSTQQGNIKFAIIYDSKYTDYNRPPSLYAANESERIVE